MLMVDLTATQMRVLALLQTYQARTGFMPTRADIASEFGWRSPNSAEDHLRCIERKGFITIAKGSARGIRITDAGREALGGTPMRSPFAAFAAPQLLALPVVDPSKVRDAARTRAPA